MLNQLVLPDIGISNKDARNPNMYCDFDGDLHSVENTDMRILTAITMESLDCNALWIPHRQENRDDYMEILASIVTVRCRGNKSWNGSYKINSDSVNAIVKWIEKAYNAPLYHNNSPSFRPENTPKCPSCSTYLRLSWVPWGMNDGRPYRMALTWICPMYKALKCKSRMSQIWPDMCPSIITKNGVFFHNWDIEGHPIPDEFLIEPLSVWSLSSNFTLQTAIANVEGDTIMEASRNKRGRGNKIMTEEMEEMLKISYSEYGPAAVQLSFEDAPEWDQIVKRANTMGLTLRKGASAKELKKYIASVRKK